MRHFDAVCETVARELGVTAVDVLTLDGRRKLPDVFYAARTVIVIAMHDHIGGCSYPSLGERFGRKHNTLIKWVDDAARFDGVVPGEFNIDEYAADVAKRVAGREAS